MADPQLRILTVTSIYPTPEDPGLGAYVASQVESLRKTGLLVDILFLDVRRSKRELLEGIPRIRRRVASGEYHIVHAHFGYNGVPACLQRACPVVVSFCGTDLVSPKLRPISRWVARRADACIVKSERLRNLLDLPAEILPNGVDTDRFRPADKIEARQRLGLRPDGHYALFAANPARPEKRHHLAAETLERIRQTGKRIELLVLHNRPQEQVPDHLNAADLVLLTSSYEGSPNIVKEALACNTPVVSTDVGDVRQLLSGASNCAVCEDDPEALARQVQAILQSGARSDGRTRIAPLSARAVAARLVDIYRTLLDHREKP